MTSIMNIVSIVMMLWHADVNKTGGDILRYHYYYNRLLTPYLDTFLILWHYGMLPDMCLKNKQNALNTIATWGK